MYPTLQFFGSRLRRLSAQLKLLPRTFALVWDAAPAWTATWIFLLILQGILPIATVFLTRSLVNTLVEAIRAGGSWESTRRVLILAVWFGAVMLGSEILRILANWARTAQSELAQDRITDLIHAKSVTADMAFYDMPDFYDHLHRARIEATYRPTILMESIGSLVQNGITLAAMGIVLIAFGPMLPLALLLSTAPACYVVLRSGQQRHDLNKRCTTAERQTWYYDSLLTSSNSAAEIRLFDLGDHFRSAYKALRTSLRQQHLGLVRQQALGEAFASLLAIFVTALAMIVMIWRAIMGVISFGDLALFYQAFNQGLGLSRSLLESVGKLYENSLFLGNLFEFLELQPRVFNTPTPKQLNVAHKSIRFRDVSFRYPGSDRLALDHFNLTLQPGISAIVGPNGAGKSTLMKLLCRFYDPDEGSIEISGVNIREIDIEALRRDMSVLFQQPIHYEATVADNVRYGAMKHSDKDAITRAAIDAGADHFVRELPSGYETHLGKSFTEGTELSVGEWQRLGLARSFVRPAPIMILDEPTSAMDPWSEIEWAANLRGIAEGRVAMIITHRFTTAMFADSIHVMSGGRIVESGSHEELLRSSGLYANGWAAQAKISEDL